MKCKKGGVDKLSYAIPKTVKKIVNDLGIYEFFLYYWWPKYTADGDKTKHATIEDENRDLQRQLGLSPVKLQR